jgi:hypothetical protein
MVLTLAISFGLAARQATAAPPPAAESNPFFNASPLPFQAPPTLAQRPVSLPMRGRKSVCDGERRGQHFNRDIPAEPRVMRPIHLSHPARAQRGDDLVGAKA